MHADLHNILRRARRPTTRLLPRDPSRRNCGSLLVAPATTATDNLQEDMCGTLMRK